MDFVPAWLDPAIANRHRDVLRQVSRRPRDRPLLTKRARRPTDSTDGASLRETMCGRQRILFSCDSRFLKPSAYLHKRHDIAIPQFLGEVLVPGLILQVNCN